MKRPVWITDSEGWGHVCGDADCHIVPINDDGEHLQDESCPCEPEVYVVPEIDFLIIVHSSYDGREGLDWARAVLEGWA